VDDSSPNLAPQRVEHAKLRFDASWRNRHADPAAVEHALDELDVAVALWLDPHGASAPAGSEDPGEESQTG
jgi:hypothetical protein